MLKEILISNKYKSLWKSDTWGNDVLPEQNISSQIVDSNIPNIDYLDIQNDNILEHSFFFINGCNWFEPYGICDQLKFCPNQINFFSLSIKKSDNLINTKIFCGSLPDKFHKYFNDICNATTKIYKENFQNNTTWLQTNIHSNTS
jgi:hypothetical protein